MTILRPGHEERRLIPKAAPTSTFAQFCERHGVKIRIDAEVYGKKRTLDAQFAIESSEADVERLRGRDNWRRADERAAHLQTWPALAAWKALDEDANVADLGIVAGRERIAVFRDAIVSFWLVGNLKVEAKRVRATRNDDWTKTTTQVIEEVGDHVIAIDSRWKPRSNRLKLGCRRASDEEISAALATLLDVVMARNPRLIHAGVNICAAMAAEPAFPTVGEPRAYVTTREEGKDLERHDDPLALRLASALGMEGHSLAFHNGHAWRLSNVHRMPGWVRRETPKAYGSKILELATRKKWRDDDGKARATLEAMIRTFEARA